MPHFSAHVQTWLIFPLFLWAMGDDVPDDPMRTEADDPPEVAFIEGAPLVPGYVQSVLSDLARSLAVAKDALDALQHKQRTALPEKLLDGTPHHRQTHHGPLLYPDKALFEHDLEVAFHALHQGWVEITPATLADHLPVKLSVRTLRNTLAFHGMLEGNSIARTVRRLAANYEQRLF